MTAYMIQLPHEAELIRDGKIDFVELDRQLRLDCLAMRAHLDSDEAVFMSPSERQTIEDELRTANRLRIRLHCGLFTVVTATPFNEDRTAWVIREPTIH